MRQGTPKGQPIEIPCLQSNFLFLRVLLGCLTNMTSFLPSAISPDQRLVAIVPPSNTNGGGSTTTRLLIQIYQVATSQLQLTLTYTPTSTSVGPLKELIFCGTSSATKNKNNNTNTTTSTKLIGRMGNSQIIVWDLDRGVVTTTLNANDGEEFLGLASVNEYFYTLTRHGTKLVVYEYHSNNTNNSNNNNGLKRKIKSGRWEGDLGDSDNDANTQQGMCGSLLAVSESYIVVQTSPGIVRVMNSQTGKKIDKIKSTSSNVSFSIMKLLDDKTLIGAQRGGMVSLYNVATCTLIQIIPHSVTSVDTMTQLSDGLVQMLGTKIMIEGTIFSKQSQQQGSYEPQTIFKSSTNPIAPFFTNNEKILVMVHTKRSGCQAHWFDLNDNLSKLIDLDQVDKEKQTTTATTTTATASDKATKRKLATSTEPMILGPGQAGSEMAPPPLKKNKPLISSGDKQEEEGVDETKAGEDKDDEENDGEATTSNKDITIAERLQQLTNALEEEDMDEDEDDDDEDEDDELADGQPNGRKTKSNFKPHKATTESLKELMSQALQGGDDSLLELALAVRDVKVITTTLGELGNSHVVLLLGKLTSRLASNPLRAEGLAIWISKCLKQGKFQIRDLAPLRNLLYERTESFAALLRLEGRLALMCDVDSL